FSILPSARVGVDIAMPAKKSAQATVRNGRKRFPPVRFRLRARSDLVVLVIVHHRTRTPGTRRLAGLRLRDALAVLLPVLWPVGEQDAFADPRRLRQARYGSPEHEGLVSVAEVPGVKVLVLVHFLVGSPEAQVTEQLLDVVWVAGEKFPACPHDASIGVRVLDLVCALHRLVCILLLTDT